MSLCRFLPNPSDRMAIVWSLLSIKDSLILEYGPAGTTHFSMGLYGSLGVDWKQVLFTTHMYEDDVVMGDVSRLEKAIVELDTNYHPKVIFVLASSISSVIGTDIKGVCNYMQKEVNARLIAFEQGGFRGDYSVGLTEVYKLLVNNLVEANSEKKEGTYNIIGASMGNYRMASDIWEIKNLMKEGFSYTLNTCLCSQTSVDQIKQMAAAELNIVLSFEGLEAAELLLERYNIPYVYMAPYGYRQTLEFLQKVSEIVKKPIHKSLQMRIKGKLNNLAMYKMAGMMGRKPRFNYKAIVKGNYDLVKNMSSYLEEVGITVSDKICSHSMKNIKNISDDIKFYTDERDYLQIVRAARKCLVMGDDVFLEQADNTNIKVRTGFPFIKGSQIATHMPLMGEKGADYILEWIDMYYQM